MFKYSIWEVNDLIYYGVVYSTLNNKDPNKLIFNNNKWASLIIKMNHFFCFIYANFNRFFLYLELISYYDLWNEKKEQPYLSTLRYQFYIIF